jgi:hypothetical protein
MFLSSNNCCTDKAVCGDARLWWINQPGSTTLLDVFGRLVPSDTMFNVKKMGFALRGLLFVLWVVTVNPRLTQVSFYAVTLKRKF